MAAGIAEDPPETDAEQQLVEGLAQAELAGRVKNSAENYNLAQDMDDVLLAEIGRECYSGFKEDEDSRTQWLDDHTFWLSLYMQRDYAENSDQERSWGATESVPLLTESCDQFQARTYKAFFPNDAFISAIPMRKTITDRKELEKRAERVGNHMAYQLGYMDRNYKKDKDALFLGAAIHGSFFTKTYFSEKLKRFKVDNVRPTDLVINYNVGPIAIEDVQRKSHIIYTTVGQTEDAVTRGFLIDAAQACEHDGKNVYNIKVDEVIGLSQGNSSLKRDKNAILIEQHVYLDIDGNGFRPYIVTFDLARQKVLRLTIGFEADPMGEPLDDYKQIQYFTHYKFKENPDGFYGLGLGSSIGDLNSAINIMLRQSMDAATLANDGNMSGFISERLGLEGDDIRMVLGKLRKVPDTVGDMQNSIMLMKFPGPNQALMQIMDQLDMRAQRMGSATEVTSGASEKVIQPTTYLAQVEQALESFSAVQMRLASAMEDELQKIYKINQKYLPLVEHYMVNGAPEMITRADYADDMLVQPIFDPKFSTQAQKVARSQAIAQIVMQNPLTMTRPEVLDAVCRRQLEAMDVDNINDFIPNSEPLRIDNQLEENALFLMPPGSAPPFDVFVDQDHMTHLIQLEQFVMEKGANLMPEQAIAVIQHKMKHEGFLYAIQAGVLPPIQGRVIPTVGGKSLQMVKATTQSPVPLMAGASSPEQSGGGARQSGGASSPNGDGQTA
jgi:chaperonin GroES